ncbi:DUF1554 domain-containing protein [Leptospira gomenensis]|uniref:DUF1554 domain-containing protein n=1 Tax=Leptospira gomenensis TaxID=2484974 RepID=A0A5F1YF48_9LEPT|nr:DUF1554 domain-containing protein [Leptospira gomenensis]TGK38451.1 DUF1554 domain-containing protein [Leptospira gomenensis]TGK41001.1 DUF1554 domain-containing protein [Leptospira gomenensis]TGK42566.1 DUF1554 domain-containing protein [Leptospira gomenensis]TGK55814.1 DUF1554 domain-containing protein [Leptospira gomenensis]
MLRIVSGSIEFRKSYILKIWITAIVCFWISNCARPKELPIDSSTNGLFLNLIASETSRMFADSFEQVPVSVEEGVSQNLSIDTSTFSPFHGILYISEEIVSPMSPLQFDTQVSSTSSSTIQVNVFAASDPNCDEEEHILRLTNEFHSLVGKIRVRVLETDRCVFFADAEHSGYSGDLGGIAGADEICEREKSEFLPGSASEYKALLRINLPDTRRPANAASSQTSVDWPIRKNTRYFLHSNDQDRIEFLLSTASEAIPGDASGIFAIPFTASIPEALAPNPNTLWSGFESPNFANGSCCNTWTSGSGSSTGLFLNATFTSYHSYCSIRRSILCIRL